MQDPRAEKCAAALDVHVGHMSDPVDRPGLARFCEHMLFLGNDKYPGEDEFEQYISRVGGSSNAFTDTEDTVISSSCLIRRKSAPLSNGGGPSSRPPDSRKMRRVERSRPLIVNTQKSEVRRFSAVSVDEVKVS